MGKAVILEPCHLQDRFFCNNSQQITKRSISNMTELQGSPLLRRWYTLKIFLTTKESQCLVNKPYKVYKSYLNPVIFFLSFLKVSIFPETLVSKRTSSHTFDAGQCIDSIT